MRMIERIENLQTHAFRMQLKAGASQEYRLRHDMLWPELADLLREAGIRDYAIFLDEQTGALFATLKLADDHRLEGLADHPVMRRWWDHMADIMDVEADNKPREWPLSPMFYMA